MTGNNHIVMSGQFRTLAMFFCFNCILSLGRDFVDPLREVGLPKLCQTNKETATLSVLNLILRSRKRVYPRFSAETRKLLRSLTKTCCFEFRKKVSVDVEAGSSNKSKPCKINIIYFPFVNESPSFPN